MRFVRIFAILLIAWAAWNRADRASSKLTAEQASVLASVRSYALQYTAKLPNFICTQITSREISNLKIDNYVVDSMTVAASDLIEEQLMFVNRKESYEVTAINRQHVSGVDHTEIPGLTSTGEFGSLMHDIFDPQSHSAFDWHGTAKTHGDAEYVFNFHVPVTAGIRVTDKLTGRDVVAAYGGLVFVNAGSKEVVRIVSHMDFPAGFELKTADRSVEYSRISIAGKDYSLPAHSEVRMLDATHLYVNRIEYRSYHKFEVTSGLRSSLPGDALAATNPAAIAKQNDLPSTEGQSPSALPAGLAAPPPLSTPNPDQPPDAPAAEAISDTAKAPGEIDAVSTRVASPAPATRLLPVEPLIGKEITIRDEAFSPILQTPILRTQTGLVTVPVVVRDANGQATGGLTESDFEVFDKGKRQRIAKFAIEKSGDAGGAESSAGVAGQAPTAAAAGTPLTFVAIWFDDVHLNFGDLARARDATAHNVESLQAGVRAAIFTSSGQGEIDFTDDRASLLGALANLRPRPSGTPPGRQCPDISYYMADLIVNRRDANALDVATSNAIACMHATNQQREIIQLTVQSAAEGVLSTGAQESHTSLVSLREAIHRLAAAPGSRSLVVVSPGFFLAGDLQFDEQNVVEEALGAHVVIGALDARGLYTLNPAGDVEQDSGDSRSVNTIADYARDQASAATALLESLAWSTGGSLVQNTNDLEAGLRRLAAPPEYTYVLAFAPDAAKDDGKWHSIKVKLTSRKKSSVQARSGYFAAKPRGNENALTQQQTDEAIYARGEIHDLPVALRTEGTSRNLSVHASVDLNGLKFRQDNGRNSNDVTIVSVVFDGGGKVVAGSRRVAELRLSQDTMATLGQRAPMNVNTSFELQPGTYLVRLIVRNSETPLIATENARVEVK